MKHLPLIALGATAALLSACHSTSDTNATAPANATADAGNSALPAAPAAPMALPPAIANTQSYRCADGSVVAVDFMTDGTSAHLHPTPDASPIDLAAPEAGKPFTGNGYTVSGTGATISYTAPGKSAQSCKG